MIIELEQATEKADYKCGKSFYLGPILDTYKKKIIENPIVDKILDMIAKANIDRLDFGLKKITNIILMLYSQMRINIKTIRKILTQKPK